MSQPPIAIIEEEDDTMTIHSEVKYPTVFSLKDVVSWGHTGMVYLDPGDQLTVVKSAFAENNQQEISVERDIYERFRAKGEHPGLLECQQIAAAVHFAHVNNVIHGDPRCGNILLDAQLDAKITDFGGSSLDGSPLLIAVTASHRSPEPSLSVQGDLFALGSAMYTIMTGGVAPYATIDEDKIRALYAQSKFADTIELGSIGHIITKCWQSQYSAANMIITDITNIL